MALNSQYNANDSHSHSQMILIVICHGSLCCSCTKCKKHLLDSHYRLPHWNLFAKEESILLGSVCKAWFPLSGN